MGIPGRTSGEKIDFMRSRSSTRRDDAGRHWRTASLPRGRRPFASQFIDRFHWWLVDGNASPRLYITDDGGSIWRSVTPEIDLTKYSLDVVSPRVAFAF